MRHLYVQVLTCEYSSSRVFTYVFMNSYAFVHVRTCSVVFVHVRTRSKSYSFLSLIDIRSNLEAAT